VAYKAGVGGREAEELRALVARAVEDAGFTPGSRDRRALFDALGDLDDAAAQRVERSLARAGAPVARELAQRFNEARPPLRARLCRLAGRLEGAGVQDLLVRASADEDTPTARAAIIALGKRRGPDVERALLAAWDRSDARLARSVTEALGKLATPDALARLRAAGGATLPSGAMRETLARARLTAERTQAREDPSAIDVHAAPPAHARLVLFCRPGLEPILSDEVQEAGRTCTSARGEVRVQMCGPLCEVLELRTWTALGFACAPRPVAAKGDADDAVARALVEVLTSPEARALLGALTQGAIRYRLAWDEGGHRRALVWRVAREVHAIAPELANDPTESTWEARVRVLRGGDRRASALDVVLVPRALEDARFAYRRATVAAASHPTLAAALVRLSEPRAGQVVWDPFVGSGLELVERARAASFARLVGTDRDPEALAAARGNLEAAGVTGYELLAADARTHSFRPRGGGAPCVDVILTNPPMGRRVPVGRLGDFLDGFAEHAGRELAPGGRLVWYDPQPARAFARAKRARLTVDFVSPVDMGGFTAALVRLKKPA
jgi:23S rRNA G2445 N2-methylase RlmL